MKIRLIGKKVPAAPEEYVKEKTIGEASLRNGSSITWISAG